MSTLNNRFVMVMFFLVLTFGISACSKDSAVKSSQNDEVAEMSEKNKEELEKNKEQKASGPQVSTSTPKVSKPVSEADKVTERLSEDEIYIVPNRFPLKEAAEAKEKDQDESDKSDEKKSSDDK